MKSKKIKIISIILILFLILFITAYAKLQDSKYLDNILIFNPYENQYVFDISSSVKQSKNANLCNTINIKGETNPKISPGIKGEFDIIIATSKNMKYQIRFDSKSIKPKNLLFNIKGCDKKYDKLEDLEDKLRGTLFKGNEFKATIQWSWEYEVNNTNNFQDTLDGKNIKTYNFDINVLSYKF